MFRRKKITYFQSWSRDAHRDWKPAAPRWLIKKVTASLPQWLFQNLQQARRHGHLWVKEQNFQPVIVIKLLLFREAKKVLLYFTACSRKTFFNSVSFGKELGGPCCTFIFWPFKWKITKIFNYWGVVTPPTPPSPLGPRLYIWLQLSIKSEKHTSSFVFHIFNPIGITLTAFHYIMNKLTIVQNLLIAGLVRHGCLR